ncbi:hypothetical protein PR202_gb13043 [Eleusine coracana subsp. coracana]|uniref:Uncharacterized protein n=1 Tax=Eleusine coracana subsp. coracana TaxID=191504 RepID=A0AAV5EPC8_ELECO|nr:hypothetical protein PR202_gb13043 [Eleusine coracana subsp. coracana]
MVILIGACAGTARGSERRDGGGELVHGVALVLGPVGRAGLLHHVGRRHAAGVAPTVRLGRVLRARGPAGLGVLRAVPPAPGDERGHGENPGPVLVRAAWAGPRRVQPARYRWTWLRHGAAHRQLPVRRLPGLASLIRPTDNK